MPVEMSWFSALCDDDYEFLGVPDDELKSSWEHCRNIVLTADRYGSCGTIASENRISEQSSALCT